MYVPLDTFRHAFPPQMAHCARAAHPRALFHSLNLFHKGHDVDSCGEMEIVTQFKAVYPPRAGQVTHARKQAFTSRNLAEVIK
jgi:hypothetical protein